MQTSYRCNVKEPFLERGLSLRTRKLDQAAHAAWLYYIAGNTQEEIAAKLNVSRQAAQRLVALAVSGDRFNGIAVCAATHLETYLVVKTPTILAFSTGRTLRSMVDQIPSMNQLQHKIVSIVGNMSQYGCAGCYEVVMHLCDRVGSQVYPVPTPVESILAALRGKLITGLIIEV
ncbi:MAG TPA: sugar-binding domain-containing protein [Nodularia sp. (in: cyanobacteria)]|nr:sugar-binding domain-containing protein [Nodularia sp. (in: cyanobacteria)]